MQRRPSNPRGRSYMLQGLFRNVKVFNDGAVSKSTRYSHTLRFLFKRAVRRRQHQQNSCPTVLMCHAGSCEAMSVRPRYGLNAGFRGETWQTERHLTRANAFPMGHFQLIYLRSGTWDYCRISCNDSVRKVSRH